jgi:folylpolyglutamate synthase/dihydropteroate synthase
MNRSTPLSLVPLVDGADFQRFIGEFTNYESMKEYRYSGDTMCLDRMLGLMRDLGDPQESFESVHIAGTKGKGTTGLILEALLAASGSAVGTYTSPHVEHLRERIRLCGEPISDADSASSPTECCRSSRSGCGRVTPLPRPSSS